jgi:hypothetical protein
MLLIFTLAWSVCQVGAATQGEQGSYLITQEPGRTGQAHAEPYCPQEGDLVLFKNAGLFWKAASCIEGSPAYPHHCALVVRRPDGSLGLLEVAPNTGRLAGLGVCMLDVVPRLHHFDGVIYVRRIKAPLTPKQSADLTHFAVAQQDKHLALGRWLLLSTPFNAHAKVWGYCFGKTDLERHSWICSELVIAAGTVAGLFDSHIHKANALLPFDLYDDRTCDISGTWWPSLRWSGNPPAAHEAH